MRLIAKDWRDHDAPRSWAEKVDRKTSSSPPQTFDLVLHDGLVIDSSQGIHAVMDVGMKGGLITSVKASIDPSLATANINCSGYIVTAGLVDLLAHPWPQQNLLGINADYLMKNECTTTIVSPGDPGAPDALKFINQVSNVVKARVYAYIMISNRGYNDWPSGELPNYNPVYLDAAAAANVLVNYGDVFVGVKVRMGDATIGFLDLYPLQQALLAAQNAQATTGKFFPVVVHTGGERTPTLLSDIVGLLRAGDVITHVYDGNVNTSGQVTGFAQNWVVTDAAYAAKVKGVILDTGWGGNPSNLPVVGGSFDYLTAGICLTGLGGKGSFRPDTLSSDAHAYPNGTGGLGMHLTEVMSNFFALNTPSSISGGQLLLTQPPLSAPFTIDDLVRMTTVTPASVLGNRVPKLGTLQVGAPADVAVLQLISGSFTFCDSFGRTLTGNQKILPVQTIKAGAVVT